MYVKFNVRGGVTQLAMRSEFSKLLQQLCQHLPQRVDPN